MPNNLKKLRKEFGFSQKKAAEIVGITETSFAQIERGEYLPQGRTILKISKLFSEDPRKIFHLDFFKTELNI